MVMTDFLGDSESCKFQVIEVYTVDASEILRTHDLVGKAIQNSSNPRVASKKAGVSRHAVPRFLRRASSCQKTQSFQLGVAIGDLPFLAVVWDTVQSSWY